MPRRRLIAERVLSSTERVRRHRLRGIEPPPAPGRSQPDCGLPTFEELVRMVYPDVSLPVWPEPPA
jgi:hypothetical protein